MCVRRHFPLSSSLPLAVHGFLSAVFTCSSSEKATPPSSGLAVCGQHHSRGQCSCVFLVAEEEGIDYVWGVYAFLAVPYVFGDLGESLWCDGRHVTDQEEAVLWSLILIPAPTPTLLHPGLIQEACSICSWFNVWKHHLNTGKSEQVDVLKKSVLSTRHHAKYLPSIILWNWVMLGLYAWATAPSQIQLFLRDIRGPWSILMDLWTLSGE